MNRRRVFWAFLFGISVLVFGAVGFGGTITVALDGSGDYTTIQAAIDDAVDGDTVIVADGTYTGKGNKEIKFMSKAITVRSENGPENCIVDCQGSARGFIFNGGETNESILDGFTIKNGYAEFYGAGIYCYWESCPLIKNCIISGNLSESYGGGMRCRQSSPVIMNCVIKNNTAEGYYSSYGGGLNFEECENVVITNCVISNNSADNGGGIYCDDGSNIVITNSTLVGNSSGNGDAINCDSYYTSSNVEITNCIIWNGPDSIGNNDGSTISIQYSDIFGGWEGLVNVNVDPLFVNEGSGDYHLLCWSECVDAGTNSIAGDLPEYDPDGNMRLIDGDNDGIATVDMGAYETLLSSEPVIWVRPYQLEFIAFEVLAGPDSQILTIRNSGNGIVAWSVSESCEWLTAEPTSGMSTGEDNEVTLSVDLTGLSGGLYTCELEIADSAAMNNPQVVVVTLKYYDAVCVPSEYSTIQEAIDSVGDWEVVVVSQGTYNENVNFGGKDIIVTSTNPDNWSVVESTVIQGTGSGCVVTFGGTESAECVLEGFTITGGYNTSNGGGVQGNSCSAGINRCLITNNTTDGAGGGVQNFYGHISHCKLIDNIAGGTGGGLAGCPGLISNCLIAGNTASNGNAINNCDGQIVNCTIAGNTGGTEGTVRGSDGTITNCIVWGNDPDGFYNCGAEISYCCYAGAEGEGNINAGPMFIDTAGGDYHLLAWSPCVDEGTNSPAGGMSDLDLQGNTRVIDGDNNGSLTVDMGAYETAISTGPVIEVSSNIFEFVAIESDLNPPSQQLEIRNSGSDTLNWIISEDCGWLSVNPESGDSTGEFDAVEITVDIADLGIGDYMCELTISADGAGNSPCSVVVTLHVVEVGSIDALTISYQAETYAFARTYDIFGWESDTDNDVSIDSKCESKAWASYYYAEEPPGLPNTYASSDSRFGISVNSVCIDRVSTLENYLYGEGSWAIWGDDITGSSGDDSGEGNGWGMLSGTLRIGIFEGLQEGARMALKLESEIIGNDPEEWEDYNWYFKIWDENPEVPLVILDSAGESVVIDVEAGQELNIEFYTEAQEDYWPEGGLESLLSIEATLLSAADINVDGDVNLMDFDIMASQWQGPGCMPDADIVPAEGNGIVDADDLLFLVGEWLRILP